MKLTTLFVGAVTLGLSAPVLARPEPVSPSTPNSDLANLQKRATACGVNEHDGTKCPAGAACNCAIMNPCAGYMCMPNYFYFCVKAGCQGCDYEEM